MEPVKGIGASFWLDDGGSPVELTDISDYLDNIDGSSNPSEYDGTTFQPGVQVPLKKSVPGFADKGFTLSGKWCAAVETFFAAIEGKQGLNYRYGPEGVVDGKPKISGLCNCMSYSGPKAPVDGLVTFDVTLKVTSRVVGTFSGSPLA